jgi:hypothetical protein
MDGCGDTAGPQCHLWCYGNADERKLFHKKFAQPNSLSIFAIQNWMA